jgi:eukaryotic-like serine/threonine-protein kinase
MQLTADQWQQIKNLLERTLEQPAAARADWLRTECADPRVRAEVLSLLEAHSEVGDFLEKPSRAGTELVAALRPESLVDERIGPWRLAEEIGRGGMGTVYRAVRADEEFHQEVAIKIVTRGMDTDVLLRRFRTERQILANLEHPYIARLFDGGTTPSGLPYFVMEYVQGDPLTVYCDKNRLGVGERIELFRKVCSAVAYAHQNLVVHRDLKPANILVTEDGTPKLLDFGIARLMSGPGREMSEPTVTMLRMATPAYASPEQIRGLVAGTPSDIYSLGVILYELLTGHRPYRLPTRDSNELARVICEREPTRASVVVGFSESIERSNGELTVIDTEAVCADRDTTLDQLRRRLRGDLDNILSMALRKEPHRRYETVEQFSHDLQRHINGLPIVARRDTWNYRLSKFVERHRGGVAAGVLAVLLLTCLSIVALHKAARLESRLEEDQRLATSFLVEVHDSIAKLPGSTPAREAILQQSLKYLNRLSTDAGDAPAFQRSLALAYERFAELQVGLAGPGLGRSGEALETCGKARAIREDLARRLPDDIGAQYELANNYLLSGYIAGRVGSPHDRQNFDEKALAIARRLVEADSRSTQYRQTLARALGSVAYGLQNEDKWEPSREHLRQALAIYTELVAEAPENRRAQRELAQAYYRMGVSYVDSGHAAEAVAQLESALEVQEQLLAADPDNNQYQSDIAAAHHFLGVALGELARPEEALKHFDRAIAIRQAALQADPRDTRSRAMLAGNYAERSVVQLRAGDAAGALSSATAAVSLQEEALNNDPRGIPVRISMAQFERRLGAAHAGLAENGRGRHHWKTAAYWYGRSVAHFDELRAEGHMRSPALREDADGARKALDRCRSKLGA